MNDIVRGIRSSLSLWRTSPGVALIAVAALAMGIGFTTTMFSIVHGATRPLPFDEPHEIVAIEKTSGTRATDASTRPFDYLLWADAARTLDAIGAYESVAVNLGAGVLDPERVTGVAITANAFALVGQGPLLGRTLQSNDMRIGATPVVVLSHALWQRRFGSDQDIVGKSVRLTGTPYVVAGVMPQGFGFPINASFWIPLALIGGDWQPGVGPRLRAFGRLADGTSREAARAELNTITSRGGSLDPPASLDRPAVNVVPFQDIETPREIIRGLYLLVVAVSFVLLIACSNVATLLIARAAVRARDVALRLALGATRKQLVIEQLAESLSLSLVAMLAGLAFAHAGTRLFAINSAHIIEAFWVDFYVDRTVLLFASLLAAVATVAAGLGPALRTSHSNVSDVLKDRAHSVSSLSLGRLSRGLLGVQVALACGLLALTMILARSAVTMRAAPWPFDPERILTFECELTNETVSDPAVRNRRLLQLAETIQATPGVEDTGLVTALPGRGGGSWTFALDEPPAETNGGQTTSVSFVSPGFFEVVRARAERGRLLTVRDDASAPRVAVVNESFARRFSSNQEPIGRRLFLGPRDFTIVGVVPDLMARDVQERRQDGIYASILQTRPFGVRVMVRGLPDPTAMMPVIRAAMRQVDPDMPLTEIFTLHEAVYRDKRVLDILSSLFLVFGIGALTLTAIGLYGVVSFGVAQRRREIGIRLALGATRAQVLQLVVGQGSRQLVVGLVAGLVLAFALSRGFAAAVEAIPPADAPLLAGIVAALGLTVVVALVIPVRRALMLEIVRALRHE